MEMDERRENIVKFVNDEGNVAFSQLKKLFPNVSDMTLRTDLKALDEAHRIVRVHGGARSVGYVVGTDDLLDSRSVRNVDAKLSIAQKAAELLRPDTTAFFDSGSTTTMLAHYMPDIHMLLFTNSITVLGELARLGQTETIIIGGKLNRFSLCANGSRAIQAISQLAFDQLFLGVTSYQTGMGFTCGSDEEAALKRTCIEQAEQTIVLMDSSKVGHRSTFSICNLDQVDIVVSDGNLPGDFLDACMFADVKVI